MTITDFIKARLDEDDAAARAWLPFGNPDAAAREHIARHDPARVLRDVEAKRRIVDRHAIKPEETGVRRGAPICAECGGSDWKPDVSNGVKVLSPYPWVMPWPCPTLRLLALAHTDHPDYDPTWSPA